MVSQKCAVFIGPPCIFMLSTELFGMLTDLCGVGSAATTVVRVPTSSSIPSLFLDVMTTDGTTTDCCRRRRQWSRVSRQLCRPVDTADDLPCRRVPRRQHRPSETLDGSTWQNLVVPTTWRQVMINCYVDPVTGPQCCCSCWVLVVMDFSKY